MGIPPLLEAMGLPSPRRQQQSAEQIARTMRSWVAATRGQRPN